MFRRLKARPNEVITEQVNFRLNVDQEEEKGEEERLDETELNETISDDPDGRPVNEIVLDNTVYETPGGKDNKKVFKCDFCEFTSTNPGAVGSHKRVHKDMFQGVVEGQASGNNLDQQL